MMVSFGVYGQVERGKAVHRMVLFDVLTSRERQISS